MPNVTIAEAFRYLLYSFIGFLYLLICDPEWAKTVLDTTGDIGFVGIALAIGALLYVCYRRNIPYLFTTTLQKIRSIEV